MSQQTIRKAFETRIAAWAALLTPILPISYQNKTFAIPNDRRYGRCIVLPGRTDFRDLQTKVLEYVGVYQLDLSLSINTGTAEAHILAQSLNSVLPTDSPLVQDGMEIWIVSPMSEGPSQDTPNGYLIPISAQYRAVVTS